MNRDACIALMLRLEGGFVDDPHDPGGATKFGITQKTLNASHANAALGVLPDNVKDLRPEQASAIYAAVDWADIHGDDLPAPLAALMMNSAVNQGEPTSIGMLQDILGLPRSALMSERTLDAVKTWHSPYMPEQTLAEEFAAHVGAHYAALNANLGRYELGWFRRLLRVYTLAVQS